MKPIGHVGVACESSCEVDAADSPTERDEREFLERANLPETSEERRVQQHYISHFVLVMLSGRLSFNE